MVEPTIKFWNVKNESSASADIFIYGDIMSGDKWDDSDTTAKSFQVQIGQGVLEYNRLVAQLRKNDYNRALCVDLAPLPNLSPESELRKMRLLMESIL